MVQRMDLLRSCCLELFYLFFFPLHCRSASSGTNVGGCISLDSLSKYRVAYDTVQWSSFLPHI